MDPVHQSNGYYEHPFALKSVHQDSRPHGSIMWLWIHEICPQNHLKLSLCLWTLHTRVIDILGIHLQ